MGVQLFEAQLSRRVRGLLATTTLSKVSMSSRDAARSAGAMHLNKTRDDNNWLDEDD